MAYFANGSEGYFFETAYCERCKNNKDIDGNMCPILEAHEAFNYEECNNKASILHILWPRGEDGRNLDCRLFTPIDDDVAASFAAMRQKRVPKVSDHAVVTDGTQ